jgi:hypothetical protein
MAKSSTVWTIEKVVAVVGLVSSLVGVISTWTLLQYRISSLEEETAMLAEQLDQQHGEIMRIERDFSAQGRRVQCDICRVHDMECPGC